MFISKNRHCTYGVADGASNVWVLSRMTHGGAYVFQDRKFENWRIFLGAGRWCESLKYTPSLLNAVVSLEGSLARVLRYNVTSI
jgi:hypothetical protein